MVLFFVFKIAILLMIESISLLKRKSINVSITIPKDPENDGQYY